MKRRLFMRLNEAEFETLRRLHDLTFGVCSYRETLFLRIVLYLISLTNQISMNRLHVFQSDHESSVRNFLSNLSSVLHTLQESDIFLQQRKVLHIHRELIHLQFFPNGLFSMNFFIASSASVASSSPVDA